MLRTDRQAKFAHPDLLPLAGKAAGRDRPHAYAGALIQEEGIHVKLAEALLLRADRKRTFEQLRSRAQAAARFQEGEDPPEDANALLVEAEAVLDELETLILHINNTNSATRLGDGRTVTAALAERDVLSLRFSLLSGLADAGAGTAQSRIAGNRQMRSELRVLTAVPVGTLRDRANVVARRHRELDALIQQANWNTDLLEEDTTN